MEEDTSINKNGERLAEIMIKNESNLPVANSTEKVKSGFENGLKELQSEVNNHKESDSLLSVDEVDALPARLKYTTFDLFCTLVSIVTYAADLAMDIIVATYFYHLGKLTF